jgi:pimeloyl-ACP methyl ester carboxylesterase
MLILPYHQAMVFEMTDLSYDTIGRGEPVLLIQGVGVAGCGWQPQIEILGKHFEVAWFDNRGIGNSPDSPSSVLAMSQDALGVMDALEWPRAHVVGHSLGGVIAQQMAILAPHRIRSLGLLCTYARGRSAISFNPADLWLNMRTAIGTQAMRRRAFFELVTDPARNISEENILELESVFGRNLAALPRNAMAQVFALMRWNLGKGLSIPEIPTLVISATNDRVAPVAEGRLLAERWNTEWIEVAGGHALTIQDAERINYLLLNFLCSAANQDTA